MLHSAWPVRFDLPLASFENSVAGAHNLLELSRELGARFVFISSVGTVMNAAALQAKDGEETFRVVEAERAELEYAMGGYGVSRACPEFAIGSKLTQCRHRVASRSWSVSSPAQSTAHRASKPSRSARVSSWVTNVRVAGTRTSGGLESCVRLPHLVCCRRATNWALWTG